MPDTLTLKLPDTRVFIAGAWRAGDGVSPVLDKFSLEPFAEVQGATRGQVAAAVAGCQLAFDEGVMPPPFDRARILERASALISERKEQFVGLMVREAGFTIVDAQTEVDRAVVTLRLCAEEATRIVGETVSFASTAGQHERIGFTIRAPLGVVCAITPFNSPLNTVCHKVGPAIAAGDAVVLKPAGLTPLSSALLCEILLEAGLPLRLLALVHGSGSKVGQWLLEEQAIAFYTFTGSTQVGRQIQLGAGIRRTQLELGSIASTIVCADADLDRAIGRIANAAFRKAGQVCTSIQRLYVGRAIVGELTERLSAAADGLPAGDPSRRETKIGPMITEAAAVRAESWLDEARQYQARIVRGGARDRAVLDATIVSDVQSGMKVLDQEVFAPVVCVLPFDDLGEAIKGANGTPYGLAAGIFTQDVNQALVVAKSLRFGAVHINETSSSRADAMPFGGVKASGHGHEGPRYAIRELTEERLITFNS